LLFANLRQAIDKNKNNILAKNGQRRERTMKSKFATVCALFVKPAEGASDEEPTPSTVTSVTPSVHPTVIGSLSGGVQPANIGAPHEDPQVRAQLEKAMLSDGDNSVSRFRAAYDSLVGIIDEADKRFLAAIKVAGSQGLKPEAVLADILSDEGILTQKEAEFRQLLAQERESVLGAKQREVDAAAAAITAKRQQIEALQRDIVQLEAGQTALQAQTEAEAHNLADIEGKFTATLAVIRTERKTLEEKIRPHCTKKGT
jgi:hypothetical protein